MLDSNNTDWWRGAVIYQIYPRSFCDTNGDGVGDLQGIRRHLAHVANLGADAVWISPFFKSPMKDFGYDVEDFRAVDPLFGSIDDFKAVLADAHALGLRVLIDLVMSHTSDQHAWFKESRQSRDNPQADWYVWADPLDTGAPPNNWLALFGGSAWQWDTRRSQYYLHNFLACQPDLNFHHPEVQAAVLEEARFWLDLGVDGFRLDVVNFYFHDRQLRSNPPLPAGLTTNTVERSNPYSYQDHLHDKTQPENLVFLERLRALMDSYPGTATVGELGVDRDVGKTNAAYTAQGQRLNMAYSFELLAKGLRAPDIRRAVIAMEQDIGDGWVSWALTNHDFDRVVSRWNLAAHAAAATPVLLALLCSLRGSPCLYQGDELGLTQAEVPRERLRDPYGIAFWPAFLGRDGCRTPLPWEQHAPHGGFSSTEPWLPMAPEHLPVAVDVQRADPASPLQRTSRFLAWRRSQPVLKQGDIGFLDCAVDDVLLLRRSLGGQVVLAAFNLGPAPAQLDLNPLAPGLAAAPLATGNGFEGTATLQAGVLQLQPFGAAFLEARSS